MKIENQYNNVSAKLTKLSGEHASVVVSSMRSNIKSILNALLVYYGRPME